MNISKAIIALLMLSCHLVFAQSIQLTPHDNPVNASITGPFTDISTEITVQNSSNESKDIMVSRQVVDGLPGTENYFVGQLATPLKYLFPQRPLLSRPTKPTTVPFQCTTCPMRCWAR